MRQGELLFAYKTQIEKDHNPERNAHFHCLLSGHPILSLAYHALEALPAGARALVSLLYACLTSARFGDFPANAKLAVTKYKNEKKQVNSLEPALRRHGFSSWCLEGRDIWYSAFFFLRLAAQSPGDVGRLFRVSRHLCRRYPLYVALRGAETIFFYIFFRHLLARRRFRMLLTSSDGNPYGRALMAAAWAEGVPLVFAAHGAVAAKTVRAKCALALLHGKKAEENLRERGSMLPSVLHYGFKEKYEAMRLPAQPRKFVFCLGQAFDLPGLADLCRGLKHQFPSCEIVIRPHPHSLVRADRLVSGISGLGAVTGGLPLREDLHGCDIVIAPNSTVHLECLVAGIPTAYVPRLDLMTQAPLAFLRDGLVFRWEAPLPVALPVHSMAEFYSRDGFVGRLSETINLMETNSDFLEAFDRWILTAK